MCEAYLEIKLKKMDEASSSIEHTSLRVSRLSIVHMTQCIQDKLDAKYPSTVNRVCLNDVQNNLSGRQICFGTLGTL